MGIDQRQLFVSFIVITMHLFVVVSVKDLLVSRLMSEEKPHQESMMVRLFSLSQEIHSTKEISDMNAENLNSTETHSRNKKVSIERASKAVESVSGTVFYGPKEIDKRALPLTEPDVKLLNGIPNNTGLPIRVRLYIDQYGVVSNVQPLQNHPDDASIVEKIIIMLEKTAFIPAMRSGKGVASYQDLEFNITTLGPKQHQ